MKFKDQLRLRNGNNNHENYHRHTRYSEQLYVLEGELTAWAGENKMVLSAGESFLIHAYTPRVVASLGERPARGLIVAAPSAFARLIAAVGTLEETEPPDMALFECISAEIGDEVLGPPGTYPTDDTTGTSQSSPSLTENKPLVLT